MSFYVRTGNGGADPAFLIQDLGFTVPTGAGWTELSYSDAYGPGNGAGQFTAIEIKESFDLFTAIDGNSLEWSMDGVTQETGAYDADSQFVVEVQNNDWDFTDGRVTLPTRSSGWPDPRPGDIFYDSDDGYLAFYDGYNTMYVALTESGDIADHGSLTGLGDDDHTQYLLLSGNAARNTVTGTIDVTGGRLELPSDTDPAANYATPVAGEIAYDSDDGYLVFYDGVAWVRVADSTSSVTDHGALTGLLDDDHTQYPLMTGNAARNAITGTFDFGDGYLIAPTYTAAPVTSVVDGAMAYVSGELYMYDGTRSKWLSVSREMFWMGRNANNASNIYLRAFDGLASSSVGYRMMKNGTITGIVAQADVSGTGTLEVRRNDTVTVIASLTVTAALGNQVLTTNVNVSQGDEIQLYINGTASNPSGAIEVAWRI